jgi:hypothetical protein
MLARYLSSAAVAITLGLFAAPASAAPVGLDGLKSGTGASPAQKVAHRHCWYHRGHRHCRWVGRSYGYGPGVTIYLGGRHGHHRHRHHRRWDRY